MPGIGRVELQVEGRRLDGLLLVAGQAGEAVGEGVGDEEVHDMSGSILDRTLLDCDHVLASAVARCATRSGRFSRGRLRYALDDGRSGNRDDVPIVIRPPSDSGC